MPLPDGCHFGELPRPDEQDIKRCAKRIGDPLECPDGWVAAPPLEARDVGSIQVGQVGKLLLRNALIEPEGSDCCPKLTDDVHAIKLARCRLLDHGI